MQEKTMKKLHEIYCQVCQQSSINAVDVLMNLKEAILNATFPEEDNIRIDYLLNKIEAAILGRSQTFAHTNMCTEILFGTMLIAAWINDKYNQELDVNITARRKSLESELAKSTEMADNFNPAYIRDRFGIRLVTLNEEDGIYLTCFMITKIIGILCNLNRQDRNDFERFLKQSSLDDFSKERVLNLLKIPFTIEPIAKNTKNTGFDPKSNPEVEMPTDKANELMEKFEPYIKNYFRTPKRNGYQSIHFVLSIDPSYTVLPGFQVEFQARTWKMHNFNENDKNASHAKHKEDSEVYASIFRLDSFENVQIRGFYNYDSEQNDVDGIHHAKVFYNRRMNNISF